MSDAPTIRRDDRGFALVLGGCFLIVVLILVSRHVMWRDEIRTWQMCSECSSLRSLWGAMAYEGVPVLWYWIVFVLTRMGRNPVLMQIVHALIATSVVYVIGRWAPFSRWSKGLLAFGYFPLFEYGVIARNYSLVFLLVMVACAIICASRTNFFALTIVLFLLTQVSIWGAGFAGVLWLTALMRTRSKKFAIVSGAIVLAGIGLCYFECSPGPGLSFVGGWELPGLEKIVAAISTIYRGLLPIPLISTHFWNTNILDSYPEVEMILGLILGIGAIFLLWHRPTALIFFVLGAAGLLGFASMRFVGMVRHQGQFFILLVAAFWIAEAFADSCRLHNRSRQIFMNGLLAINLLAGVIAMIAGLMFPFSATKQAAEYVESHFDDHVVLVGLKDWCVSPMTAYLHRPIYFPQMQKFAFYNTQNDRERNLVDRDDLIDQIAALASLSGGDVIYILSSGDKFVDRDTMIRAASLERMHKVLHVKPIAQFDQSIVADEAQTIYLIEIVDEPAG
jgi:hypothetical protein